MPREKRYEIRDRQPYALALLASERIVCTGASAFHGVDAGDNLGPMFVIELTYRSDIDAIDAHMQEHMVFVRKHYASGHFLVSGRKVPRDGGIILAVGDSKQELEAIMKEDPFYVHGLIDFRIVEFLPSQKAKNLAELVR